MVNTLLPVLLPVSVIVRVPGVSKRFVLGPAKVKLNVPHRSGRVDGGPVPGQYADLAIGALRRRSRVLECAPAEPQADPVASRRFLGRGAGPTAGNSVIRHGGDVDNPAGKGGKPRVRAVRPGQGQRSRSGLGQSARAADDAAIGGRAGVVGADGERIGSERDVAAGGPTTRTASRSFRCCSAAVDTPVTLARTWLLLSDRPCAPGRGQGSAVDGRSARVVGPADATAQRERARTRLCQREDRRTRGIVPQDTIVGVVRGVVDRQRVGHCDPRHCSR